MKMIAIVAENFRYMCRVLLTEYDVFMLFILYSIFS